MLPSTTHFPTADAGGRDSHAVLDAVPRPWRHNPSAWRQRIPICLLAMVAFAIAVYMALYQWRLIDGVWDPVFGRQSEQVLDSNVSERTKSGPACFSSGPCGGKRTIARSCGTRSGDVEVTPRNGSATRLFSPPTRPPERDVTMWSRVIEMLLGLWLAAGAVVAPQLSQPSPWRLIDIGLGCATIVLAAASFWPRAHYAHLLLLAVGAVLIGTGYLFLGAPPPAAQNRAVVGFLLLMFGIIPNHASRPHHSWAEARCVRSVRRLTEAWGKSRYCAATRAATLRPCNPR